MCNLSTNFLDLSISACWVTNLSSISMCFKTGLSLKILVFKNRYLGDGPKLVRELFRAADELAPSIVFIGLFFPFFS